MSSRIDRLTRSEDRSLPTIAAVGAATALFVAVELLLADSGHGTHLLLFLLVTLAGSLVLGHRAGFATLGAGAAASALASLAGLGPPDPAAKVALQLVLYLGLGTTALLILSSAVDAVRRVPTAPPIATQGLGVETLTPREREVLRLAAGGMSVHEVADRLVLSPNTVKSHLSHAYDKLAAHNRAQAVRAALHCGCIASTDICPHQVAPTPAASHRSGETDHPIG
jgi:DNA-binding CsgD family transcriptional regulator